MGEWWTTKQPCKGCAVVKPGEVGRRWLNGAERAPRPIDLHHHATAAAGQGTCSIPRHNHLRGCGAPPTHTRGNAADGATPGFGAEPLRGSRKGNHCPKVSTIEPSTISGAAMFCASKPLDTHERGMSGTCHAQLFMTRSIKNRGLPRIDMRCSENQTGGMKRPALLIMIALAGMVFVAISLVDVIPPRSLTATRMHGLKRRVMIYCQAHGELPPSLASLPAMEGYNSSIRDGWNRPITFQITTNGVVPSAPRPSRSPRANGVSPHFLCRLQKVTGLTPSREIGQSPPAHAVPYANGLVTFISLGRDGRTGGADLDADIIRSFPVRDSHGNWSDQMVEWSTDSFRK